MTRPVERSLLLVAGFLAGLGAAVFWWPSRQENPSSPALTVSTSPVIPRVADAPPPAEPARPPRSAAAPAGAEPAHPAGDAAQTEIARRERQLGEGLGSAHLGFMMYATENDGRFPESLENLPLRYFRGNPPVIRDPLTEQPLALEYTTGLTTNDSSRTVVLATAPMHDGRRWIVLLSGAVMTVSEAEYKSRVEELPALEENSH